MSLNLASILSESAARFPYKVALVHDGSALSYKAVDSAARKLAGALANLGIRKGQHVALMLPNVPQFTIAYYAAHYLGAPVVPLNVQLTPDEIAYHLGDSDAVALVAWEGCADHALAGFSRAEACKHLILANAGSGDEMAREGTLSMTALIAAGEPL